MGATKYVSYASALVVRQLKGVQYVPRMAGLSYFLGLFKDQYALEVVKNIKQDWKLLVYWSRKNQMVWEIKLLVKSIQGGEIYH